MSTPVLYAGASFFAQKSQGEGRRFRPSPPSLLDEIWEEKGFSSTDSGAREGFRLTQFKRLLIFLLPA